MVRSAAVDIVVVDSVAALVPELKSKGKWATHMGLQARLMSQALRKITGNIGKSGCTVVSSINCGKKSVSRMAIQKRQLVAML